jgi:predicted GTPase
MDLDAAVDQPELSAVAARECTRVRINAPSSPTTPDRFHDERHKAMNAHTRMKKKADELFNRAEDLANGEGLGPLLERLRDAHARLDAERLYVVVCGEWRRGKSSLINMLLEEHDLCPTGTDVTTAVVTVIQFADQPRFTVFVGEPGNEEARPVSRDEIGEYVSERFNPGNRKQARLVLIELPNPRLREGLVVVDTPGVGGALARHTDITYAFIPKADAVLFVTDPSPLTVPELEFVKLIDRHCKNVLFVVTKMDGDAGRKAGPVIEGNGAKIAAALGSPDGAVSLIPISSNTKQDYLASGDERDLADSGFAVLEKELWRLLGANRARVMLVSALVKLDRTVGDLREPRAAELAAVTERDQKKIEAVKAECEAVARRIGDLQENSAAWRGQMADGLNAIRRTADQALSAGFREIRRLADRYLKDDAFLRAPEQIPAMLETDIDALLADIQEMMERGAGELHAKLETATGLDLRRASVDELAIDSPEFRFDPSSVQKIGLAQKAVTVGREVMFSASGGATIGGLLGALAGGLMGLVGGPVGVLLGAKAGFIFGGGLGAIGGKAHGLKSSIRKVKEADQAVVSQKLAPEVRYFVEDCESAARNVVADAQAALADAMKAELNDRLLDEKRQSEEVIERIKQARSRTADENAARVPILKNAIARSDAIRREVATLAEEAMRQAPLALDGAPPFGEPQEPPAMAQPVAPAADAGDWADV